MSSTKNPLHRLFKIDVAVHGDYTDQELTTTDNIQVISLGLSRTGTSSLQEALIKLGFGPCHGGTDVFRSQAKMASFHSLYKSTILHPEAVQRNAAELRRLTQGYRCATDWPIANLAAEAVSAYPDARFILTTRPGGAKAWWKSIWATSHWLWRNDWQRFLYRSTTYSVGFLRRLDNLVQLMRVLHEQRDGCWAEPTYDRHNSLVRDLVPKEQLLEYDVRQGWEPLCKFLGVEVPDEPFPNFNDTESLQAVYVGMIAYGAFMWVVYFGVAGGAVALALNPSVGWRVVDAVKSLGRMILSW